MAMTAQERKEYKRAHGKKVYKSARRKLMGILGGSQCVKCGRATDDLELDHINNDGKRDRELHGTGEKFLKYHITHPEIAKKTLQVLCASCHAEKTGRNWWR